MSDHKKEVIPPPTLEGERESGTKRGGRIAAFSFIHPTASHLPTHSGPPFWLS